MANDNIGALHPLLFEEGRELLNIKFHPGTNRGLTKGQVADATCAAIRSALAKGPVNNPPLTGRSRARLEDF